MSKGHRAVEEEPESGAIDLRRRHRRLVSRTVLVSGLTLVSRILGYAREIMSAALFGDRSAVYDAFITAWRVPNLFRRFLGEGALSTAFQATLTEVDGNQGRVAGRELLYQTLHLLTWILVAVCIVVMLVMANLPDHMPITGWAWLGADPGPVREFTVRLMPFVVLICLSALVGGALQVRGHFAAPAWAPAVLNVVWIASLFVVAWQCGWGRGPESLEVAQETERHMTMGRILAWGVLLAGAAQLLVQFPALRRMGLFGPRAQRKERPGFGSRALSVLRRSAPLALGAAVYQINVMVDGLMAEGLLPNGGPTLHYFANRVQQFPMALIAVAATSAVFPALQALGHHRDRAGVRSLHDRTQRAICFVALPASFGLFALAEPVISVSFEHGAFGSEGVARASAALRMLALAILPAGAAGLTARAYYALDDFVTPVRVSIAMLSANVGLNLVFIMGRGMDVDGLALATAVSAWATLLLLQPGLNRKLGLPPRQPGLFAPIRRMVVGAALSALAAWSGEVWLSPRIGSTGGLLGGIFAGMLAYLLAATALRLPEARSVWRRGRR